MIVYLDASALVKRYVAKANSVSVTSLITKSSAVGTAVISRAEVSAALGKAMRKNILNHDEAASALQVFTADWENLIRLNFSLPVRLPLHGIITCGDIIRYIWRQPFSGRKCSTNQSSSPPLTGSSGRSITCRTYRMA